MMNLHFLSLFRKDAKWRARSAYERTMQCGKGDVQ